MKSPVLHFFELKLRVLFNSTPSSINKSSRITEILLKKSLKLGLEQRFSLIPMFILILVETDLLINKKDDK